MSRGSSTMSLMTAIELLDEVAAALMVAAVGCGATKAESIAQVVCGAKSESAGLDGFFGCMDSGGSDWAGTDAAILRKAARTRRSV